MITLEMDYEIINTASEWEREGEKLALAIVVKTWGSSPRQPGSMMLIREDGHIVGSVSGGCVEGAVIVGSKKILQENRAELMQFGVADEDAWSVGLSCGGKISVFVCPLSKIEPGLFQKALTVADAGTGSGAIAAAYAKENPSAKIVATDTSTAALAVAKRNFDKLDVNHIELIRDDWLKAIRINSLDMIITNPPYVDAHDTHLMSLSTSFEPTAALYAQDKGMSEINKLIQGAKQCLKPGGFLLVEHGFAQKNRVVRSFLKNKFVNISTRPDLAGLDRVTYGQKICIDT